MQTVWILKTIAISATYTKHPHRETGPASCIQFHSIKAHVITNLYKTRIHKICEQALSNLLIPKPSSPPPTSIHLSLHRTMVSNSPSTAAFILLTHLQRHAARMLVLALLCLYTCNNCMPFQYIWYQGDLLQFVYMFQRRLQWHITRRSISVLIPTLTISNYLTCWNTKHILCSIHFSVSQFWDNYTKQTECPQNCYAMHAGVYTEICQHIPRLVKIKL
jgi:hypothetical protein